MLEADLINKSKSFIEQKLFQTQRKLEVIYSTTKDEIKRSEIKRMVNEIERDRKKLESGEFTRKELAKYDIRIEELEKHVDRGGEVDVSQYKILRNIFIEKLNGLSNNAEINSIWTYMNFFGREYLGLLSEQNLRLDYGHAYQRDKFFTVFTQNMRLLEEYGRILEQIEVASSINNIEQKGRLLKMQNKQYRDIIMKVGNFLYSIYNFIEDILKCEKEGEEILLEPDKVVEIKGTNSMLDGMTAREALMDLYEFAKEFISFIKVPDLKKIEEEKV